MDPGEEGAAVDGEEAEKQEEEETAYSSVGVEKGGACQVDLQACGRTSLPWPWAGVTGDRRHTHCRHISTRKSYLRPAHALGWCLTRRPYGVAREERGERHDVRRLLLR